MDQTTQSPDHLLLKTRVDARHRHRFADQQGRIRARYLFIITYLTHYPFLERAQYHGILPLVHDQLQRVPDSAQGWPQQVLQVCRENAISHAMWELRHHDLLKHVLEKLAVAGVRPVLFKGTALAYNLYHGRALRTRGDTDLIIPFETLIQVGEILKSLSFERGMSLSGEFITYEASCTRHEAVGGTHSLDVHWRISNSELLSRLFNYQELLQRAYPIPDLGSDALGVGTVDALLIACFHRVTHKQNPSYVNGVAYYGGDRLIWLYDMQLLLGILSPTGSGFNL